MRPPTPLTSFLLPLLRCFGFASFCWRGRSRRAVLDGGEITISEKNTNHAAPDSSALVPFPCLLLSSFLRPGVSAPSFFLMHAKPHGVARRTKQALSQAPRSSRCFISSFGAAAPGPWGSGRGSRRPPRGSGAPPRRASTITQQLPYSVGEEGAPGTITATITPNNYPERRGKRPGNCSDLIFKHSFFEVV